MRLARTIESIMQADIDHRVLVFVARAEDACVAAGEFLQFVGSSGAELRVVVLTDADMKPWSLRHLGRRVRGSRPDRRDAMFDALAMLGVNANSVQAWGYPAGELSEYLIDERRELVAAVKVEIERFKPTWVITPSCLDLHPDCNAIGLSAAVTLRQTEHAQITHLAFLLHGPGSAVPLDQRVTLAQDGGRRSIKRRAIMKLRSHGIMNRRQASTCDNCPEAFILNESEIWTGFVFCAVTNACHTRLACNRRHEHERLWVYPGMAQMQPARIAQASKYGAARVQLGCRQSDTMQAARDATGWHIDMGACIDPIWIKLDTARQSRDMIGWIRVVPLPSAVTEGVCCVIPCHNVADTCGFSVRQACRYADIVIAVDDGSTDETLDVLECAARELPRLQVLTHNCNRGKGHALLAGFRYGLAVTHCNAFVTLSAGGQHNPEDIPSLVETLKRSGSVLAVGACESGVSRLGCGGFGDRLIHALMRLVHPGSPRDARSGFRAYDRDYIYQVLEYISGGRHTTEIEMLVMALEAGGVTEIPVTPASLASGRRSYPRSFFAWWRMLMSLLRYRIFRQRANLLSSYASDVSANHTAAYR